MIKNSEIYDLDESREYFEQCLSIMQSSTKSPGKHQKVGSLSLNVDAPKNIPVNKRLNLECIICLSFIQLEWREW